MPIQYIKRSQSHMNMTTLNCRVKVNLVVGGRMYVMGSKPESSDPGTTVDSFFVSSWVGGASTELSKCKLRDDHTADITLPLCKEDVETVKFCISYNVKTANGARHYHLASDFMHKNTLARLLSDDSGGGFQNCKENFIMNDNFNDHSAVLLFSNMGTDVPALKKVCTQPSALLNLKEINTAVCSLGQTLQQKISMCTISNENAGTQFVNAFSYGHMKDCLTHYAILGDCFHNMSSGVDLPMLMYLGYQTSIATAMSLPCVSSMSDDDLVSHFGVRMVTLHTTCDLTAPYSSDLTLNAVGVVCKDTEDIAKTMCALLMRTQGVEIAYPGHPNLASQSWAQSMEAVKQFKPLDASQQRLSQLLIHDDCENHTAQVCMNAAGLTSLYRVYATQPDTALHQDMLKVANGSPLFANITPEDHKLMGSILLRLGALQSSGKWSVTLGVVSAKGPSFKSNALGENLSGHGCGISRHLSADNTWKYQPLEGTSYLVIDKPVSKGLATSVDLVFQDGTVEAKSISDLATIIGQNVHCLLGVSCNSRIAAHIAIDNADPPFYKDIFYCGLKPSNKDMGCVTLNTKEGDNQPKFGIPVLSLSAVNSVALPVDSILLDTGDSNGDFIEQQIGLMANEAWGPAASPTDVAQMMSFWQPVASLDSPMMTNSVDKIGNRITAECNWSFDNPANTATAVNFYSGIADRFNLIQQKCAQDDGIRMSVHGKFLSASMLLHIPIPKEGTKFQLSTMANLRQCVLDLGIATAVSPAHVKQRIQARKNVNTDSHFYMCDMGSGLVHAHIHELA